MKLIFVVYGFAWVAVIAGFALKKPWAWTAMLVFAVAAVWYLWVGTISSLVQIVWLLLRRSIK